MTDHEFSLDDVRALAEDVIADKRSADVDEGEARELYDVPAGAESTADASKEGPS